MSVLHGGIPCSFEKLAASDATVHRKKFRFWHQLTGEGDCRQRGPACLDQQLNHRVQPTGCTR